MNKIEKEIEAIKLSGIIDLEPNPEILEWINKRNKRKLDLTLVPPEIIEAIAKVRERGNIKYKNDTLKDISVKDNWKAIFRHILEVWKGNMIDAESGMPHSYHIACRLAFIIKKEAE